MKRNVNSGEYSNTESEEARRELAEVFEAGTQLTETIIPLTLQTQLLLDASHLGNKPPYDENWSEYKSKAKALVYAYNQAGPIVSLANAFNYDYLTRREQGLPFCNEDVDEEKALHKQLRESHLAMAQAALDFVNTKRFGDTFASQADFRERLTEIRESLHGPSAPAATADTPATKAIAERAVKAFAAEIDFYFEPLNRAIRSANGLIMLATEGMKAPCDEKWQDYIEKSGELSENLLTLEEILRERAKLGLKMIERYTQGKETTFNDAQNAMQANEKLLTSGVELTRAALAFVNTDRFGDTFDNQGDVRRELTAILKQLDAPGLPARRAKFSNHHQPQA